MKIAALSKIAKINGLKIGDEIVSVGGYPFVDELDLVYFEAAKNFEMSVLRGGETVKLHVKKGAEQSLGITFDEEMKPYHCKNKCVFCFVDQLPKGMRDTLYIKDDDYRYSFISGSYVTMTNVSEDEIERIIRLKLSPLYISVHAFDDDVRTKLVRNPNTKNLISVMRRLGANGIKMHTQLVVVPTLNDGEILKQSIEGLHGVEGVLSVAAVPVGLTGHREGLDGLRTVSKDEAERTIDDVEKLNEEYGGFCWCSDEYYLKAERKIPDYDYYGGYEQIENGVGLLADWKDNLTYALDVAANGKNASELATFNHKIGCVTGQSFAKVLQTEKRLLEDKLGLKVSVLPIENNFFGKSVTVAGLVTAGDIIAQCKAYFEKDESLAACEALSVPDTMLREFTDTFLDNVRVEDVEKALGKKIVVLAHNGSDTPQKLIEFFEQNN